MSCGRRNQFLRPENRKVWQAVEGACWSQRRVNWWSQTSKRMSRMTEKFLSSRKNNLKNQKLIEPLDSPASFEWPSDGKNSDRSVMSQHLSPSNCSLRSPAPTKQDKVLIYLWNSVLFVDWSCFWEFSPINTQKNTKAQYAHSLFAREIPSRVLKFEIVGGSSFSEDFSILQFIKSLDSPRPSDSGEKTSS